MTAQTVTVIQKLILAITRKTTEICSVWIVENLLACTRSGRNEIFDFLRNEFRPILALALSALSVSCSKVRASASLLFILIEFRWPWRDCCIIIDMTGSAPVDMHFEGVFDGHEWRYTGELKYRYHHWVMGLEKFFLNGDIVDARQLLTCWWKSKTQQGEDYGQWGSFMWVMSTVRRLYHWQFWMPKNTGVAVLYPDRQTDRS